MMRSESRRVISARWTCVAWLRVAALSPWRIACCGLAGVTAAGCTVGPDYAGPGEIPALPEGFREAGWKAAAHPGDGGEVGEWWKVFRDPALDELMARVGPDVPEIDAALRRIDQARAATVESRSGLFPSVDGEPSAVRERNSGTTGNFRGGERRDLLALPLALSWELDLWGRTRRGIEGAVADEAAREADRRAIELALRAEVARQYFTLRGLDAEIARLEQGVEVRRQAVGLMRSRFEQGDAADLEVAQAEAELGEAEAEVADRARQRRLVENALAAVLGTYPSNLVLGASPLDGTPPRIPATLPTTLLERRPDIAAAERRIAAANARIGVAQAALFPSISIGADGGLASAKVDDLFDAASRTWALGLGADAPIFDAGARRARVNRAIAERAELDAEYRTTVVRAVREVEDALASIRLLARQAEAVGRTIDAAERATRLARQRYGAGFVSFFEVVDTERTLLRNQQEAERIRGERFAATVDLVRALGGGW